MNRAVAVAAVLILLGGGYALLKAASRHSALAEKSPNSSQEVRIEMVTEHEETDTYIIDAKYPRFGIPVVDARIKEILASALAEFKLFGTDTPPPPESAVDQYEFQSTFESAYAGGDIVSAQLIVSMYTGGAHPLSHIYGLNFNRTSGRELTLDDVLSMTGLTLEILANRSKEVLNRKLGDGVIAIEGADPTRENYQTFIVDAESVKFIFQEYQVASYAAGTQEVSFPRKN